MTEHQLFIGGEWVSGTRTRPVRLPWDGSVVATVQDADRNLLDRAIRAAERAAPVMREMSNEQRSDLLLRVRSIIQRDAAELATALVNETGKPLKEARVEVERAPQTLMAAAIAARELAGEAIPIDAVPAGKGRMAMSVREPVGIVGAITPWNVPLNLSIHKVASAIGSGNTVVHKPSELTPVSALRLAAAFEEAGCPAGAYNVVIGEGETLGAALVRDPRVRMITFTGSVEVGEDIRANAGLKKVTLELGGNSPVIIEADADMDLAVSRNTAGAFNNSGQVCISVQRIYVHESIEAEFTRRLADSALRLVIGHPAAESTDVSSMITEQEAVRVEQWIADAVAKGAKRICGGERRGATVTPCVLQDVPDSATMACREVFGPVVAVRAYRELDDAIQRANGTPYGLQAGIFTRDLATAFYAARRIQAGGILINDVPAFRADHMPYGGTKDSGLGREGPKYAMEEMTDVKLICWR